jgi:PAS domain S-box-containing protein
LRSATDNAAVGLVMLDCERRYTFANPAYAKILGLPHSAAELIGKGPADVLASIYETQISPHLDRAFAGERVTYELVRPRADAVANETDHYVVVYDPQRNHEGKVAGVIVTIYDITERKRAEEHVRFLMRELSHRTKNVMAVVQAISWQTAQQSLDFEDFEQRFMQRLESLARSHDLLAKRDWRGVVLEDLVRAQLEPFLDSAKERLAAHGPPLLLMPEAAQDLGFALHELGTNASKYGALSVPTGKIEIGWSINDGAAGARHFHMTWRESGGPTVGPPVRKGFGSAVITAMLSRTFNGEAELDYRPEGLLWELTAPMGRLIAESQPH